VSIGRILLNAVAVITAMVLQVTVVNQLPLPGGGPDLVLLVLASLAFVQGERSGAITGFAAGLLVDLVPPAAGPVGRWAAILCLAGYAAGRVGPRVRESALRVMLAIAILSVGTVLAFAALAVVVGDVGLTLDSAVTVALATAGYDVFLSPFVIPALMGLARRVEPPTQRPYQPPIQS